MHTMRRVERPVTSPASNMFTATLAESDPEIGEAIKLELGRQRDEIELIASESIVSRAVLEAQGSLLTANLHYLGCSEPLSRYTASMTPE